MPSRKPRLAIGLPVLVAGIAMIAVASEYLGPRVPNGMPPPCFPESCPEIGYFAGIGIGGFFLALWGAIQTLFGLLVRAGCVQSRNGPSPPLVIGLSEEDQKILSMAREIHAKTKFPKRTIFENVGWVEGQPWYWCGVKRRGLSKSATMILAAGLRGRLQETDWKILLTYYLQRRHRLLLRWFALFLIWFYLILTGAIVISTWYGIHASIVYGQFVATPLIFIDLLYLISRAKSVALKHDRWFATQIGGDSLLGVFKNIDSLELPEIENAKRRRGWIAKLWPMPSITERIQNLPSTTS